MLDRVSSRRGPGRWGHPLTVAVVAGVIGLIGTAIAAVVGSSTGRSDNPVVPAVIDGARSQQSLSRTAAPPSAAEQSRASVAIQSVAYNAVSSAELTVSAIGTAEGLVPTEVIYAMARPETGHAATRRWSVSGPVRPDRAGEWRAIFRIAPPVMKFN